MSKFLRLRYKLIKSEIKNNNESNSSVLFLESSRFLIFCDKFQLNKILVIILFKFFFLNTILIKLEKIKRKILVNLINNESDELKLIRLKKSLIVGVRTYANSITGFFKLP